MAARRGDLADGGQVLASRAVATALDDDAAVVLEPAGEAELRGLPGTHEVFRVQARPAPGLVDRSGAAGQGPPVTS